nr:hypothetical protein [Brucella intermedia]
MTSNIINEFREKFGSARSDWTAYSSAWILNLNKEKHERYIHELKSSNLSFVDIDAYLAQYKWKTGEGESHYLIAVSWLKEFVALTGGKLMPWEAIEILRMIDGVDKGKLCAVGEIVRRTMEWKRTARLSLKDVNDYIEALLRGDKIWGNEQPRVEIDSVWTLGAKFFLHKIGQELNCDLNESICIMGARDIDEISVTKRTSAVHLFHTLSLETRMSYVDAAEQLIRRTKIYLDLKAANLV